MVELLIIVFGAVLYGVWVLLDRPALRSTRRQLTRHGLRLGALVAVAVLLLCIAYNVPSINLL